MKSQGVIERRGPMVGIGVFLLFVLSGSECVIYAPPSSYLTIYANPVLHTEPQKIGTTSVNGEIGRAKKSDGTYDTKTIRLYVRMRNGELFAVPGLGVFPLEQRILGSHNQGTQHIWFHFTEEFPGSAQPGDYELKVVSTDIDSKPFTLRVLPAGEGDPLTIVVTPNALRIPPSDIASAEITITRSNLITQAVSLSISELLPGGVSAFFSPNPTLGNSSLHFTTGPSPLLGEVDLTIRAEATGFIATAPLRLTIGSRWTHTMNSGHFSRAVAFGNNLKGIAAGQRNTARTTNGGVSWIFGEVSSAQFIMDIAAVDENTYVACDNGGFLLRTENAGQSWSQIQLPAAAMPASVSFAPNSLAGTVVGWKSGPVGAVFWTTDGGNSWQERDSLGNYFLDAVSHWDGDNAIVTGRRSSAQGGSPVLLRTTDGGYTWHEVVATGTNRSGVACFGGNFAVAAGADSRMSRTENGGQTWNHASYTGNFPGNYSSVSFTIQGVGTVVGLSSNNQPLVLRTTDGGATWQSEGVPGSVQTLGLNGVHMINADKVFAVGGSRIYRRE